MLEEHPEQQLIKTIQVKDKLIKEPINNMNFFSLMDKMQLWLFLSSMCIIFILLKLSYKQIIQRSIDSGKGVELVQSRKGVDVGSSS